MTEREDEARKAGIGLMQRLAVVSREQEEITVLIADGQYEEARERMWAVYCTVQGIIDASYAWLSAYGDIDAQMTASMRLGLEALEEIEPLNLHDPSEELN
jgi:hypothetical protein